MPVLVESPASRSSPFGPRTLISGLYKSFDLAPVCFDEMNPLGRMQVSEVFWNTSSISYIRIVRSIKSRRSVWRMSSSRAMRSMRCIRSL